MATRLVNEIIDWDPRKEKYFNMCSCKMKELYFSELPERSEIKRKSFEVGASYFYNSHGYRSPEFSSENQLLTLGCSYTEGYGIPNVEHTWSYMLAEKLKVKYSNLGTGGDSVGKQIRKAFAYFKKFGNPKYVAFLLPDLYRFEFPHNEKYLVNHKDSINDLEKRYVRISHSLEQYPEPNKISKLPHLTSDVITEETRHFYAMQQLWMLEQYCESNNISFSWSFWSPEYVDLALQIIDLDNSYGKNFIDGKTRNWQHHYDEKIDRLFSEPVYNLPSYVHQNPLFSGHINEEMCHQEYSHLEYFHIGIDPQRHAGMHRNIHWAEEFYRKIQDEA